MRCRLLHIMFFVERLFWFAAIIKCAVLNLSVLADITSCNSEQASPAQPESDALNFDQYFFFALAMQHSSAWATILHISLTDVRRGRGRGRGRVRHAGIRAMVPSLSQPLSAVRAHPCLRCLFDKCLRREKKQWNCSFYSKFSWACDTSWSVWLD